jgi:hypothetical protein
MTYEALQLYEQLLYTDSSSIKQYIVGLLLNLFSLKIEYRNILLDFNVINKMIELCIGDSNNSLYDENIILNCIYLINIAFKDQNTLNLCLDTVNKFYI